MKFALASPHRTPLIVWALQTLSLCLVLTFTPFKSRKRSFADWKIFQPQSSPLCSNMFVNTFRHLLICFDHESILKGKSATDGEVDRFPSLSWFASGRDGDMVVARLEAITWMVRINNIIMSEVRWKIAFRGARELGWYILVWKWPKDKCLSIFKLDSQSPLPQCHPICLRRGCSVLPIRWYMAAKRLSLLQRKYAQWILVSAWTMWQQKILANR